ncbi:MAG: ParB/RepB/Spo0J family partition protein [Candidatus Dormibacteraeota bacterium]|nr:ParB/RepB/Spo0J family partition protein [Candidatus Dormibacteraeota bacterium]
MRLLRLDPALALGACHPVPGNPRRHDLEAIKETLAGGQHRTIVVREATGDILAGNGTWAAAQELGWSTIAASIIECTDAEATKIVAGDNRAHDVGNTDDRDLVALLQGLDGDLAGTGYKASDLERLLQSLSPPSDDSVPDGRYTEQHGVIVICKDEEHQQRVYEDLAKRGWKVRVVTT